MKSTVQYIVNLERRVLCLHMELTAAFLLGANDCMQQLDYREVAENYSACKSKQLRSMFRN